MQLGKYKSVLQVSPRYSGRTAVFVDLSQDAEQRPRVSEIIPCLLRSSFLYSMQAARPLHPLEILAVQCLPVTLDPESAFVRFCPWPVELLESLSRNQATNVAGNTMFLPAVGSVLLLALLSANVPASE